MKIEIKALVRPVYLREYAAEYEDTTIWMWVNPPRGLRLDHFRLVQEFESATEAIERVSNDAREQLGDDVLLADVPEVVEARDRYMEQVDEFGHRIHVMLAEMWSQHEDSTTHWTVEEVAALDEACQDRDPRLWFWIQDEMWRLVREHREGVKKK